jgi:hypothetical protein
MKSFVQKFPANFALCSSLPPDAWTRLTCILTGFGLLVQPVAASEIVQKPLDEFVIYNLPIAFKSGNTTVLFPSQSRRSTRSQSLCRNRRTRIF